MWSRMNLKENAKVALKRNYWKCVLVALILGIVTGSSSSSFSGTADTSLDSIVNNIDGEDEIYMDDFSESNEIEDVLSGFVPSVFTGIIATVGLVVIVVLLIAAFALQLLLFNPLEVGCNNFFKMNAYETADLNRLTLPFKKEHYWNMVSVMFFRNLFLVLWTLLFIVPGIIKAYEYRLVPYILSDSPGISRQDAFRFSKEMMRGNKWNTFVLDLSFLGWSLLAAITCGIAGVFYVKPYIAATDAELFIAIRAEYFKGQTE